MRSSSWDTESRAPAASAASRLFCLRSAAASSFSRAAVSCQTGNALWHQRRFHGAATEHVTGNKLCQQSRNLLRQGSQTRNSRRAKPRVHACHPAAVSGTLRWACLQMLMAVERLALPRPAGASPSSAASNSLEEDNLNPSLHSTTGQSRSSTGLTRRASPSYTGSNSRLGRAASASDARRSCRCRS